ETLAGNPWLASFSISRVAFDLLRLNYIVNPLVICGAVTLLLRLNRAVSVSMKRLSWFCNLLGTTQGLVLTFFCSHLAFLLIAYATKNQPEIWPRYGLIFFALGLPLLAQYSSSKDFKERAVNRRKALTIYAAALL